MQRCIELFDRDNAPQRLANLHVNEDDEDIVHIQLDEEIQEDICLAQKSGKRTPLTKFDVLLDNQATVSVFKDKELLRDLEDVPHPIVINGIGGSVSATKRGIFEPFGHVFQCDEAITNVISLGSIDNAESGAFTINYKQGSNFTARHKDSGKTFKFNKRETSRGGALYAFNAAHLVVAPMVNVTTVSQNESRYTRREIAKAREARDFLARLAYVSPLDLIYMISKGMILNCPVSIKDVQRALEIYGKSIGDLKGKTVDRKTRQLMEIEVKHSVQTEVELSVDLFFVEGSPFLISVSTPLGLTSVFDLKGKRDAANIWQGLALIHNEYERRGFNIKTIHSDGEGGVAANANKIRVLGCAFNPSGAGKHVAVVERKIRTIKERLRGILNTLPFSLPTFLFPYAVKHCVAMINLGPSRLRADGISPKEAFTGIKIDANRDLRVKFGEYAQVQVPLADSQKNTLKARTEAAIALYSKGNRSGSVYFLLLRNKEVVLRDQFTALPMPQSVIDTLNGMRADPYTPPTFTRGDAAIEVPDHDEAVQAEIQDSPAVPALPPVVQVVERDPQGPSPTASNIPDAQVANSVETTSTFASASTIAREFGLHLSLRAGIRQYPHKGREAIAKEIGQMIQKQVFEPVLHADVPRGSNVLYSSFFFKEKFLPTGEFDKLKGRLVAGGNRQQRYADEDCSSPTTDLVSFLVLITQWAKVKKIKGVSDIGGAFLNASRKQRRTVFIVLDRVLVDVLLDRKPEWASYRRADGSMMVKLLQALYGCIDSSELWFEELKGFLLSLGFTSHPLDPCVFIHRDRCIELCVYVDDLFIATDSEEAFDWFIATLQQRFVEITVHRGKELNYLGMHLQFSDSGSVRISMPRHIHELLHDLDVNGTLLTPHDRDLFLLDPESPLLDPCEKDGFRSVVASLLYIAKRVRPDILLAVQFLATRVTAPTFTDKAKLSRVLKYLNGCPNLAMRLSSNGGSIEAYVDAAYGIHENGKGHTGLYITLGSGAICLKSSKQRLVGKSSTEAELIAISDTLSQILWIRDFMSFFGWHEGPAVVYQDNTSAMAICNNGIANNARTKHINIRYHFVKERIDSKEIALKHMPTERMLADMLTKPLVGPQFIALRDHMLVA